MTFLPSEFLRFRLAYKHTDRSTRDSSAPTAASAPDRRRDPVPGDASSWARTRRIRSEEATDHDAHRRRRSSLCSLVRLAAARPPAAEAAEKVRVVATIPDLKSLTEAVGGDLVEVESPGPRHPEPHEAEVRPSMMLKLRRAELLVENGARPRRWADVAVQGANNADDRPAAAPGASRPRAACRCSTCRPRASTARWATSTRSAIRTSRSIPALAPTIIAEHPRRAGPRGAGAAGGVSSATRQAFLARLDRRWRRWLELMEPLKGARVVVYHPDFIYFLTRFGLVAGSAPSRTGRASRPRPRTWRSSSADEGRARSR